MMNMIYFVLVLSVSNQAPHNLASSIHIPSLINSHLLCPSPLPSSLPRRPLQSYILLLPQVELEANFLETLPVAPRQQH